MVNFSNNVAVVISTLETYRYGSRIIEINRKCLEDVFNSLKSRGETTFMLTPALEWCESISPKYLRSSCKLAVSRLDDVYKHGRVLGNHIVIYAQPSEVFLRAIDDYLDEIGISGNHTEIHLKTYAMP